MPKRRSHDSEDDEADDASIPLPIQTFLWRQTRSVLACARSH